MPPINTADSLVSQASGSAGGIVFSRNQHGPYTRARTVPANPNTALQQVVRDAMATLTARWRDTLTPAQRDTWHVYSTNVPLRGRLGRPNRVGGLAHFIRSNIPRIQAATVLLPIVDTAPQIFNLGSPRRDIPPVLNVIDQGIMLTFDPGADWIQERGNALLLYASRPTTKAVNFYKGPYRFLGQIFGATTPRQSPIRIAYPDTIDLDSRVHTFTRLTRSDGRLSPRVSYPADIFPQIPPVARSYEPPDLTPPFFRVLFDQPIKQEAHNPAFWRGRQDNVRWVCTQVRIFTDTVRLLATFTDPSVGGNFLSYLPGVSDVHGAYTGVAALPFTIFS